MADKLVSDRVAILATHGFEESELASPRQALRDAGASAAVVGSALYEGRFTLADAMAAVDSD